LGHSRGLKVFAEFSCNGHRVITVRHVEWATPQKIERAIFERLNIEWPIPIEVKGANYSVMAAEQLVLMPAGTNEWLHELSVVPAEVEIRRLDPARANALFLARYAELTSIGY